MPGTRLSDTERRLQEMWDHWGQNFTDSETGGLFPHLKSIAVKGERSLRGLNDIEIEFKYPISVLIGRNCTGKSTILALAALGYHPPKDFRSINTTGNRRHYTGADFFFKGPWDEDITGLTIRWSYIGSHKGKDYLEIKKQTKKWMHYERRPERPVHFVGMMRGVSAIERTVLRHHFRSGNKATIRERSLDERYGRMLGEILGISYEKAVTMLSKKFEKYQIHGARTSNCRYSSFNMGTGEDILFSLFYLFQECRDGTLFLIEEIELGLHPEALRRLSRKLVEIAYEKKLQFIISSHSPVFIESLPRLARILLRRLGDKIEVINEPTTNYALSDISGQSKPELFIYCEDHFSKSLIEAALSGRLRRRVRIQDFGAWTSFPRVVWSHFVTNPSNTNILLVFDGDVKEEKFQGKLRETNKMLEGLPGSSPKKSYELRFDSDGAESDIYFLPGGNGGPEAWVVSVLRSHSDAHRKLANKLSDDELDFMREAINDSALGEPREFIFKLAKKVGMDEKDVLRAVTSVVWELEEELREELREIVRRKLENGA